MPFKEYTGDLMGLPTNDKHINFRWVDPSCKILFSMCRKGNGASCHFASDKKGLRKLRTAINEFIDFIFTNYRWCDMIIAKITPNSIKKLVEKLGFFIAGSCKEYDAYILPKEKYYEFSN